MKKQILSVTTQNAPGVLSRIAGLLRRKLFNIDSLTVGRTSNPKRSHFTITIIGDESEANKVAQAISKLIEVIEVKILQPETTIAREVVLAKFKVMDDNDETFLKQAEGDILVKELHRDGHILCLELMDTSQVLEKFLETILKNNIEVIKWVRSGLIAIER